MGTNGYRLINRVDTTACYAHNCKLEGFYIEI